MGKEIMIWSFIILILGYVLVRYITFLYKLLKSYKENKELNEWGKSDECRN